LCGNSKPKTNKNCGKAESLGDVKPDVNEVKCKKRKTGKMMKLLL